MIVLFSSFQILIVSLAKDDSESKKSENYSSAMKYKDEADIYYKQKKYREVYLIVLLYYKIGRENVFKMYFFRFVCCCLL